RSARKDVCSSASPSLAAQNASPIPHSLCYCPVAVFSGSNLKRTILAIDFLHFQHNSRFIIIE
ncbi:hypothetical protein MJI36_24780, partial [Salmonella enterica subsp. enterica serovar Lubbock]|nr:hypothetical protein [Salmonella enterica subsp. enterica serovar Lubbock]